MKIFKTLFVASFIVIGSINAQEIPETLTIEDAIGLALENNFDIKIAKNNKSIGENNATLGNAGFLPTVSLTGGYNYTVSDTRTEFANPEQPPIDASGAATTSISAGVNVNYNIFSGGSRTYTYKKLQNAATQGGLQERQLIEQSISLVIRQYLETLNLFDAYQISQESLEISQHRYIRAKEKYAFGNFSKLELLNAEVDLSNDSTSLAQAQLSFEKARTTLSNTLGIAPDSKYTISNSFNYSEELVLGTILDQAEANNAEYLLANEALNSSKLDMDLTKANMFPRLDLSGGYTFSNTSYDANFLQSNESLGWNAGLNLSYTIFNGGNRKREQANAKIQMESQQYNLQKAENNLRTNIINAYQDFSTNLKMLELSQRSLNLAETNYSRSQEAFSTGQITGIELRESQLNLANAKYNLSVQKIQTKLAEVNLYLYAGMLVQ